MIYTKFLARKGIDFYLVIIIFFFFWFILGQFIRTLIGEHFQRCTLRKLFINSYLYTHTSEIQAFKFSKPREAITILTHYIFTLSNAKHGRKYCNRSRGKLDFKGSSDKDYGTQVTVLPKITWGLVQRPKSAIFHLVRAGGWMLSFFFSSTIFHTVEPIEMKLKT